MQLKQHPHQLASLMYLPLHTAYTLADSQREIAALLRNGVASLDGP